MALVCGTQSLRILSMKIRWFFMRDFYFSPDPPTVVTATKKQKIRVPLYQNLECIEDISRITIKKMPESFHSFYLPSKHRYDHHAPPFLATLAASAVRPSNRSFNHRQRSVERFISHFSRDIRTHIHMSVVSTVCMPSHICTHSIAMVR